MGTMRAALEGYAKTSAPASTKGATNDTEIVVASVAATASLRLPPSPLRPFSCAAAAASASGGGGGGDGGGGAGGGGVASGGGGGDTRRGGGGAGGQSVALLHDCVSSSAHDVIDSSRHSSMPAHTTPVNSTVLACRLLQLHLSITQCVLATTGRPPS